MFLVKVNKYLVVVKNKVIFIATPQPPPRRGREEEGASPLTPNLFITLKITATQLPSILMFYIEI